MRDCVMWVSQDERLTALEDEMVNWLHDNGFGDFEDNILELGVEMLDDLKLLSKEDLSVIGMNPRQVRTAVCE